MRIPGVRCTLSLALFAGLLLADEPVPAPHPGIGQVSQPVNAPVRIELTARIQRSTTNVPSPREIIDEHVFSPKSVNIHPDGTKFYVHALEGHETLVYDTETLERIKVIAHRFDEESSALFQEDAVWGYTFTHTNDVNVFEGKPVESCFSHDGAYLWVTYYRRLYDTNATQPSAVAVIDTRTDEIVRVMPTGPLPKMVAASADGRYIAITHWGDNTVGLIEIAADVPSGFRHVDHFAIGEQLPVADLDNRPVNRDRHCGFCLRGTAFTPDGRFLLVGRMYGGGIAVIDLKQRAYIGTVEGTKPNVRHLAVHDRYLYLSANRPGYVQRAPLDILIPMLKVGLASYEDWEDVFVGVGARTIDFSPDGRFLFAAVHNESRIVAVDTETLEVVATIPAAPYPVGLDVSDDGRTIVSTSQARHLGSGNAVTVFKLTRSP